MNSSPPLNYATQHLTLETLSQDRFYIEHQQLAEAKLDHSFLYVQIVSYLKKNPTHRFQQYDRLESGKRHQVTFVEKGQTLTIYSYYYGERKLPFHKLDPGPDPSIRYTAGSRYSHTDHKHALEAVSAPDASDCSYLLYKLMRTDLPVRKPITDRYHKPTSILLDFDPVAILRNFTVMDFALANHYIFHDVFDDFVELFPHVLDAELLFAPDVINPITKDLEIGEKRSHLIPRLLSMIYQIAYSTSLFYKAMILTQEGEPSRNVETDSLVTYIEDCLLDTFNEDETPFHRRILEREIQLSDLFYKQADGILSTTRLASYVFSIPTDAPPTKSIIRKILVISNLFIYTQAYTMPSDISDLNDYEIL